MIKAGTIYRSVSCADCFFHKLIVRNEQDCMTDETTLQLAFDAEREHRARTGHTCVISMPYSAVQRRSCNRHSDCDAAEAEVLKRYPGKTKADISLSFHCHDDECEDCFGR